jgi:hypothetical protein
MNKPSKPLNTESTIINAAAPTTYPISEIAERIEIKLKAPPLLREKKYLLAILRGRSIALVNKLQVDKVKK